MPYRFEIDLRMPEVREVWKLLVPRTLGLASSQFGGLVTMVSLASSLADGSVTAVRNATQLYLLPVGVFGVALATAVFPTLADLAAGDDWRGLEATARRTLRFMFFVGVPATAGLVILRRPVVSLLWQHGRFDVRDVQLTTFAVLFYSLALCAHLWDELLPRLFYVMRDTVTPLLVNVVVVGINIVASVVLRRWLQVGGLGLGLSIAATAEAGLFLWLLRRRLPGLLTEQFVRQLLRIAAAGLVMVAPLVWYDHALANWGYATRLPGQIVQVAAGIALGAIVYLPAATLLRCEDMVYVRNRLTTILRRVPRQSS